MSDFNGYSFYCIDSVLLLAMVEDTTSILSGYMRYVIFSYTETRNGILPVYGICPISGDDLHARGALLQQAAISLASTEFYCQF